MMRNAIVSLFSFVALTAFTSQPKESAPLPTEPAPCSTEACSEGCCPTYDPNVDCWAEGHWHSNHCKSACTVTDE